MFVKNDRMYLVIRMCLLLNFVVFRSARNTTYSIWLQSTATFICMTWRLVPVSTWTEFRQKLYSSPPHTSPLRVSLGSIAKAKYVLVFFFVFSSVLKVLKCNANFLKSGSICQRWRGDHHPIHHDGHAKSGSCVADCYAQQSCWGWGTFCPKIQHTLPGWAVCRGR